MQYKEFFYAKPTVGRYFVMFTKHKVTLPSTEEDAAINRGIALDPDTLEVSDADFAHLQPFRVSASGQKPPLPVRLDSERLVVPVSG